MKISCLLVTNGLRQNSLFTALDSCINQVDEVVIVLDGAFESVSSLILNRYQDKKIVLVHNSSPIGLTKSLISGIKYCTHELIARIDDDDIWHPSKVSIQIIPFLANPNLVLSGTRSLVSKERFSSQFDLSSLNNRELSLDTNIQIFTYKQFLSSILYSNIMPHSSVIFRKSSYDLVGGYNPSYYYSQDYELWSRLSSVGLTSFHSQRLVQINYFDRSSIYDLIKIFKQSQLAFSVKLYVLRLLYKRFHPLIFFRVIFSSLIPLFKNVLFFLRTFILRNLFVKFYKS